MEMKSNFLQIFDIAVEVVSVFALRTQPVLGDRSEMFEFLIEIEKILKYCNFFVCYHDGVHQQAEKFPVGKTSCC